MIGNIIKVVVILVFVTTSFAGQVEQPAIARSKFYVGLELAEQGVHAGRETTVFDNVMQPYDRQDLAERISVVYQPNPYMALETGFTSFAGYGYFISPNKDSVHYGFLTMDLLGKLIFPLKRIRFFVAGGGAFVYTQLENFSVYWADSESYQGAYWGDRLFLRPKVAGGLVIQLTRRFSVAVTYAFIFGCSKFSTVKRSVASSPSLIFNKNFFPNVATIGATVILRI